MIVVNNFLCGILKLYFDVIDIFSLYIIIYNNVFMYDV